MAQDIETRVVGRVILDRPSLLYPFPGTLGTKDWELISDVPLRKIPVTLELVELWHRDGSLVNGVMTRELVKNMHGCAGKDHANIFFNQQTWVPREWWDHELLFPGTEWRDPIGILRMPLLFLSRTRCCPGLFDWLELYSHPSKHVVRIVC